MRKSVVVATIRFRRMFQGLVTCGFSLMLKQVQHDFIMFFAVCVTGYFTGIINLHIIINERIICI
jgi:hypothetical protein